MPNIFALNLMARLKEDSSGRASPSIPYILVPILTPRSFFD